MANLLSSHQKNPTYINIRKSPSSYNLVKTIYKSSKSRPKTHHRTFEVTSNSSFHLGTKRNHPSPTLHHPLCPRHPSWCPGPSAHQLAGALGAPKATGQRRARGPCRPGTFSAGNGGSKRQHIPCFPCMIIYVYIELYRYTILDDEI